MIKHAYSELFNEGSSHKNINVKYGDNKRITNTQIREESMKIVESISNSDELRFGTLVASSFDIQLAIDTDNLTNTEIEVSINVNHDTENEFKVGKYKVVSDKPSSDRAYKSIKAYDALYDIINAEVSAWYESLTFPLTLKDFRDSFFAKMGVEQVPATLVNDSMQIDKTISTNTLSGRQVLSAICELNGCLGKINRDGKFVYVVLDVNPSERIEIRNYVNGVGSYEDYETTQIGKVQIRQETNDIGATAGEGTNCYTVQDNFLVYGKMAEDLNTIATNLLSVIDGISYRPFFGIRTLGNPCYEVGDAVKIVARNITINSYILNRTLSGIQALRDVYTANGVEKYTEKVNSYDSEIKQLKRQTNILERTVEETKSTITSIETIAEEANQNAQTAKNTADDALKASDDNTDDISSLQQRVIENESSITQQATQIESKVSKTDYTGEEIASLINQTAENIKIVAKHLQLEGVITANGTFKINENGFFEATGGQIAGFNISEHGINSGGLSIYSTTPVSEAGIFIHGDLDNNETSSSIDKQGVRVYAPSGDTGKYKTHGRLYTQVNEKDGVAIPSGRLELNRLSTATQEIDNTILLDGYNGEIIANSVKTSSGADLDTLNTNLANLKIESLIINHDGEGTVTTYKNRKFSDYILLVFYIGTDNDVRSSVVMVSNLFTAKRDAVISTLHGSTEINASEYKVSSVTVKYLNETSVEVKMAGSKTIKMLNIVGITL